LPPSRLLAQIGLCELRGELNLVPSHLTGGQAASATQEENERFAFLRVLAFLRQKNDRSKLALPNAIYQS
jgi:hypothetical protein